MKKLIFSSIGILLLQAFMQNVSAQADVQLSNLTAPVKVNADLTPDKDNKRDLGKTSKMWKDLYLRGIVWREGYTWLAGRYYSGNTFVGLSAGYTLITAGEGTNQNNTIIGSNAGFNTTTGVYNTFVGTSAGYSNTSGGGNVFVGQGAGNDNTTGQNNTFLGIQAGTRNISGRDNVMIGEVAGGFTKTGNHNVFMGNLAGYLNSSGSYNAYVGDSAGMTATSNYNVMMGSKSGTNTTTGSGNTFVGANTAINNINGSYNTAIGFFSLDDNNAATGNTALGYSTGTLFANGSNNTFVGYDADASAASLTNSMALGNGSRITASNQVRIGNSNVGSIGGYADWSNISDGRYKMNIKENVPGLAFINKLKPITYNLDMMGIENKLNSKKETEIDNKNTEHQKAVEAKQKEIQTGFIAQDVEKIAKQLGYEFSGVDAPKNENDLYSLRYAEFVVPLVKAVQELSKMNDEKDALILEMLQRLNTLEKQAGISSKTSNNETQNAYIAQNIPNPFNGNTVINYFVPDNIRTAKMNIINAKGAIVKTISLSNKGAGQVSISSKDLSAGSYFYELILDGKKSGSRQMTMIK